MLMFPVHGPQVEEQGCRAWGSVSHTSSPGDFTLRGKRLALGSDGLELQS